MSNSCDDSVIDLTNSFVLADHNNLNDTVIDLVTSPTDDSIVYIPQLLNQNVEGSTSSITTCNTRPCEIFNSASGTSRKRVKRSLIPRYNKKYEEQININTKKTRPKTFGECPICWDELGVKPLASTKCGHVYCLKCLENALQIEKKCPCCRRALKGSTAYHPLYLAKH